MIAVDWVTYYQLCDQVAWKIAESKYYYDGVIAIARGGMYLGDFLSRRFNIPLAVLVVSSYDENHKHNPLKAGEISTTFPLKNRKLLIVDDIIDSGNTLKAIVPTTQHSYQIKTLHTAVIWSKPFSTYVPTYFARDNETRRIIQPFEQHHD